MISSMDNLRLKVSRARNRRRQSPEQRAAAFESWSANHRVNQPLSDYAVSRESMYGR